MSTPPSSLRTVLVVDDEPLQRSELADGLTLLGFEVKTADDGLAALEILETEHFDLIITDLNMPHLDGLELLQTIKVKDPDADVLVVSGAGSIGTAVLAMKFGASNFLEKPLDEATLRFEIQRIFDARRPKPSADDTLPAPGAPPGPKPPMPAAIGRYEVRGIVGIGGMGTVYECVDPVLDRTVAVKTLEKRLVQELGETEQFVERFRREAKAAAKLNHPNIVAVHDFGFDDDLHTFFLAMELVTGESVRQLLRTQGSLPLDKAVTIAFQIADGLALAHQAGIVHRDVKPLNILVTPSDNAKLVDFGIARIEDSSLTDPGVIFGSVSYTSPEIITGDSVDHRSDQFSLGNVLFEMVTGVRLFEGKDISETMRGVVTSEAPKLDRLGVHAPVWLQQILDRMLAKSPDRRYADEARLLSDLAHVGEELGLTLIATTRWS